MHDLVIRGGTIVDGTGAAPRRGDVAIDGARITAVGAVPGPGRETLDAQEAARLLRAGHLAGRAGPLTEYLDAS